MSSVQSSAGYDEVARGVETIRGLADVLTAPPALIPQRLSAFLAPLIPHSALVFLVARCRRRPARGSGRSILRRWCLVPRPRRAAAHARPRSHPTRARYRPRPGRSTPSRRCPTTGRSWCSPSRVTTTATTRCCSCGTSWPCGSGAGGCRTPRLPAARPRHLERADGGAHRARRRVLDHAGIRPRGAAVIHAGRPRSAPHRDPDRRRGHGAPAQPRATASARSRRSPSRPPSNAFATTCVRSCATARSTCSSWNRPSTAVRSRARSRTGPGRWCGAPSSPSSTGTTSAAYACSGIATGRICSSTSATTGRETCPTRAFSSGSSASACWR